MTPQEQSRMRFRIGEICILAVGGLAAQESPLRLKFPVLLLALTIAFGLGMYRKRKFTGK